MFNKIKEYFEVKPEKTDCLFCKIANKEIPAKIIAENNYCMAFMDINPMSNGHTLVIPKKHFNDLLTCDPIYLKQVTEMVQMVTKKIDYSSLQP